MSNRGPHRRLNKRLNYGLKFVFVLSLSMFQQLFPKCFLQNQHFAANLFLPTARKPAQRFCFFCVVICWGGRGVITFLVFVFFDLRWTRLLYFAGCTASYVGHVYCLQVSLKRKEVLALWRNAYPSKIRRNLFARVSNIHFLVPTAIIFFGG